MANILITNICNQKCPYCFAANQLKQKKTEMSFKDLKFVLNFLKRSREKIMRLMGGEPTLHSQFSKVVDYILSQDLKVHIFTNGLFANKITNFLVEKEKKIKYSFNINPPEYYSSRIWKQILKNLERITPFKKSLVGAVLWQKDFNIDYLLDLAEKFHLRAVILRIANPIINQKNQFLHLEEYSVLAKNLIREIKKTDKDRIKIGLGCGFSKKMFSKKQLQVLKEYKIVSKGWGCDGNSGRFDINTDLSVFRCFPLSDWQMRSLFDFENTKEVEDCFTKLMGEYQFNNSKVDFIHQGPCFSYLLSKK